MSQKYLVQFNKPKKYSKINMQRYLHSSGEPKWDESGYLPAALEAELLEDSYSMRRHFRLMAQKLRKNMN